MCIAVQGVLVQVSDSGVETKFKLPVGRPMSERSGDWGAGLSPGVGVILKVVSHAKTMTSPLIIPTVLGVRLYLITFILCLFNEFDRFII